MIEGSALVLIEEAVREQLLLHVGEEVPYHAVIVSVWRAAVEGRGPNSDEVQHAGSETCWWYILFAESQCGGRCDTGRWQASL